jgi:hypothetical protein
MFSNLAILLWPNIVLYRLKKNVTWYINQTVIELGTIKQPQGINQPCISTINNQSLKTNHGI